MARAPVPGRCKTRLAALLGAKRAAQLYRAMLLDVLEGLEPLEATKVLLAAPEDEGPELLRSLAPPSWRVVPQEGADLTERLVRAFDRLFELEVPAVVLGSDSPTLPFDRIGPALAELSGTGRVLLGPASDGGYYLVGLSEPRPELFRGIRWSTGEVMEQTRQRARHLGLALAELPEAYDVDDLAGLERLREEVRQRPGRARRCAALLA
ncbi:MAG: TIGR04282 family arsenosugar biosynthesis glycosyltransferase [Myxococcales bacterium]|nr:TIGR04282 family arsenosugar biosynthesis glycosyltransferase [Myxococcales bacterium]